MKKIKNISDIKDEINRLNHAEHFAVAKFFAQTLGSSHPKTVKIQNAANDIVSLLNQTKKPGR
jgi:hypothetical protein